MALAYIGGLFENSGSAHCKSYRRNAGGKVYTTMAVAVSHKDRRCLQFIIDAFDVGSIVLKDPSRSPVLRYQVVGQKGLRFLEDIRPFVISKRAQIDAAVRAYWDSRHSFRDDRRAQ